MTKIHQEFEEELANDADVLLNASGQQHNDETHLGDGCLVLKSVSPVEPICTKPVE